MDLSRLLPALLFVTFSVFNPIPARADPDPQLPPPPRTLRAEVRETTGTSAPAVREWHTSVSWVWLPGPRLALRATIDLPFELSEPALTGDGFIAARASGKQLVIDLDRSDAYVRFGGDGSNADPSAHRIALRLQFATPYGEVDSSCDPLRLALQLETRAELFVFAWMTCRVDADTGVAELRLYHPSNFKLQASTHLTARAAAATTVEALSTPAQLTQSSRPYPLEGALAFNVGEIFFLLADGGQPVTARILHVKRRARAPVWTYSVGLAGSGTTYHEEPLAARLDQVGLELKLGATRPVANSERLTVDLNGSLTALPLIVQPAEMASARFWNVEARFGFLATAPLADYSLVVEAGWGLWGMIVPGWSYGVKNLTGPQFVIRTEYAPLDGHPLGLFVKVAGFSGTFSLDLGGQELSVGAFYQLGRFRGYPVSLTLDMAYLNFASKVHHNSLGMIAGSGGLRTSF